MTTLDLPPPSSGSTRKSDSLQDTLDTADRNRKLAAWVKSEYSRMKSDMTKQHMIWYVNMAMYAGNQYAEILPRLNALRTPNAPPYRVRHVSNRIKPIIRTELARLTSQKPSATVVPASSDDDDMFAAYAAEQVWEAISNRSDLQAQWLQSAWWMCITGNGFLKVWWDKNRIDHDSGERGDVCIGAVTPFHLFVPDLREEDIQQQPYVLNVYTKPVAWVKKFFGINANPDVVAANEILNNAYLNLDSSVNDKPDQVLCMEMWIKDGGCEYLEGDMMVQVVGDQVVRVEPMYQHGQYPFIHFGHIPTGKFHRESVINDLIPLQREYNRTRSQLMESKNRMARPQLLAALGSVDPQKITNEPGLVIQYRAGMPPPQPIPLTPIPQYVTAELDRNIADMEDISGQHQVSRGDAPPGVTAATAISYLQEKDDSLMTHTFQSVERGMEKVGKQVLSLVNVYWDTQRTVKVVGEDNFFDTLMLRGADLQNATDIRMEGGSSLPTSKAAKQALLMDMMKMGFIEPNDGLKMMDIGGVQKLWQRLKTDEAQAQRENIRMKMLNPEQIETFKQEWQQLQQQEVEEDQALTGMAEEAEMMGQPPIDPPPMKTLDAATGQPLVVPPYIPVNTWDNHEVHIEVHNRFRKTQAFELLSDEVKAQFELHVQAHQAAITQAMMEVQGMMGGGGMPDMPPGMEQMMGAPGEEPPGGMEESGPPPPSGGM